MDNHILNECPIQPVVDILSGKWASYILWEIYNKNNHYGSIKKQLPGISTRTLAVRLKFLESKGILNRTVFNTNPPTVTYDLTNKGLTLAPILKSMKAWSELYQ